MNLYNIYTETELVKVERDKLPDSSFGLPNTRQYPLHDDEHIRKAIQMFNHCSEGNRKELANNIFLAAMKSNIEISDKSSVYKYLSSKQQKELANKNERNKELIENSPMLSFVEFYQFPLNDENIEKYGKDYKELSVITIKPETRGLILVDKHDQVVAYIRVDGRILHDINVNPIYRNQGIGSKLLNTEVGRSADMLALPSNANGGYIEKFFKNNGFKTQFYFANHTQVMSRESGLNEDSSIIDTVLIQEGLNSAIDRLNSNKDIVNEMEDFLNGLYEASVAGVACVAPLAGKTIRKPFVEVPNRASIKKCPNMFDYDEFYEKSNKKFVCSEEGLGVNTTHNIGFAEPMDIGAKIKENDKDSSSTIKKPQAMMEDDEDIIDEDTGVIGAILWDIIKFIVKLPFKIGKFIAKRIKNSNSYKIDKAVSIYRKFYKDCLDVSKLKSKEISLKELCKELKVKNDLEKYETEGYIKVTAWYKGSHLISYFIEILETKKSTEFQYLIGIVDREYNSDPTKTLLCAIMEYKTKSYGKYLEKLNTILRKNKAKLLEDIDATASSDSEIVDYKDQSTDVIVGIDRYTCHKDKYGCYYIKLNANEYEDEVQRSLIMPYLNEDMYITSDFHINHKNRNSANFANLLVSEINAKVPVNGTLMICGDLGNKGQLQKDEISDFIRRLNVSRKILLLGNHDNLSLKDYYDMGFTFVTDKIENYHYIFSHCPVDPKGKINIHGHIHESNEYWNMPSEGHINVYIGSHDNKVYQLKDYLKFYKQGKYKGTSIEKTFD